MIYKCVIYQVSGAQQNIILGWDVAGIVTETCKNVTKFKSGDEELGNFKFIGQANAYAEYVAVPEKELVLNTGECKF